MNKRQEKFRIVSVSPRSSHYRNRKDLIGRTCVSKGKSLVPGWNWGIWLDVKGTISYNYFLKIKLLAL